MWISITFPTLYFKFPYILITYNLNRGVFIDKEFEKEKRFYSITTSRINPSQLNLSFDIIYYIAKALDADYLELINYFAKCRMEYLSK